MKRLAFLVQHPTQFEVRFISINMHRRMRENQISSWTYII